MKQKRKNKSSLKIGWAQADITPPQTILLCGQFHIRLSEGVRDPLTATALVLDGGDDHAVFVSCDLVCSSHELRNEVCSRLAGRAEGLDPRKVILNGTHTHCGPEVRYGFPDADLFEETGKELGLSFMDAQEYVRFASGQIADAVAAAWNSRAAGRIAFGMGWAVVGFNRRWTNIEGVSRMYGDVNTPLFSHIEGYEEHSVGVVATRDEKGRLTGLIVNVPCPSQVSEGEFVITADYWHDVRVELRRRFGEKLFVLPQCSAAGDQSPHPLYEKQAKIRMFELAGRTERQELAFRIGDGVERALQALGDHTDAAAPLKHHVETMQLPLNQITKEQAQAGLDESETYRRLFEEEKKKLNADPSLKKQPRWYMEVSRGRNAMLWHKRVADRYEQQEKGTSGTHPCEVHVVRLGDIVFATNPFEYYLDYGIFIKVRSKAVQTFLVQLAAGPSSYVPSLRSALGGGYGSIPASNPVGPEGGRLLAEKTIEYISNLWA